MIVRVATLLFCAASGAALAASSDTLPERLTGRWEASNMDRFQYNGPETITFEGSREPGPVSGRVMHQGVVCSAADVPFTGTWDGKVLRLEVEYTAISPRASNCTGTNTYVLERKADKFEGKIRSRQGNTLNATLAP